jgi:hypothetical protein
MPLIGSVREKGIRKFMFSSVNNDRMVRTFDINILLFVCILLSVCYRLLSYAC